MSIDQAVAPVEPCNDAELLAKFVDSGSDEALTSLIQRHSAMVLGVCRRMAGDADAEDAAQAVFVLFWQKAKQIKAHSAIAGWLHRTAHHVCRNVIRSRVSRSRLEQQAIAELHAMSNKSPHSEQWSDIREILDSEVNRLPDKLRVPFVLFHLENRSLAEVATIVGSSVSTVGTWLQRGRARIAGRLRRRGIVIGAGAFAALLSEHATAEVVSASLVATMVKTTTGFSASGIAAGEAFTPALASLVKVSAAASVTKKVCIIAGVVGSALATVLIGFPLVVSGSCR